MKEESEKVGLKLNIQKTKIMASGPITSWQIDGESVANFIFGDSKITVDGDCSHEIKRPFLLENSRPLSPWGPLESLSTCLGTDSLKVMGLDAMILVSFLNVEF